MAADGVPKGTRPPHWISEAAVSAKAQRAEEEKGHWEKGKAKRAAASSCRRVGVKGTSSCLLEGKGGERINNRSHVCLSVSFQFSLFLCFSL